jgi:hypothetical protein
MKAEIDGATLEIFCDEEERLHIAFSCMEEDSLSTEDLFLYLKKYAINPEAEMWYEIAPDISVSYDSEKSRIDFMGHSSETTDFSDFLPRRLCVDWRIITPDDRRRLEISIKLDPLIEERKERVSVRKAP